MSGGWPDSIDLSAVGIPPTLWTYLSKRYAFDYADPTAQNPEAHYAAWMLAGGYLTRADFWDAARPAGPLGFLA